jgi:hypothetical protein
MPALPRRPDPGARQESWLIHYDDVPVPNAWARNQSRQMMLDLFGLLCILYNVDRAEPHCIAKFFDKLQSSIRSID